MSLPTCTLLRVKPHTTSTSHICTQTRSAHLLKRPHRPYTFTQLTVLSDGSTYRTRTTSPSSVYRSTKDSRNHPLWQPSNSTLQDVEEDEGGRLARFRGRFGMGWEREGEEAEATPQEELSIADVRKRINEGNRKAASQSSGGEDGGSLMDLISGAGFGKGNVGQRKEGVVRAKDVEEDPGEKLVNARTPQGKVVQVKQKDLEAFRKSGKENW